MLACALMGLLDCRAAAQGGSCTGCQTSTNGVYTVMTFNGSGSFTSNSSQNVSVLVVGGGGGGGGGSFYAWGGGGGGAGGVVYNASLLINSGTYPVTVGAGGSGGSGGTGSAPGAGNGQSGGNSIFSTITATGGGYGSGGFSFSTGGNGGSGGGAAGSSSSTPYSGGSGTSGQGYGGGSSPATSCGTSGGAGGGAGGTGANGVVCGGQQTLGGAGASYSISGSPVTYATGGSGASFGSYATGTTAAANTGNGGGGGGGGGGVNGGAGGAGGSGVVIISFLTPGPSTITGLSPAWGLTGQQVTITGSGFGSSQGTSTVTFNGVSAGMAASWSATSITVSVPSGATTGSVVVTTGGGASNGMTFTVASSSGGVEPWVYGSGGAIYFTGGNVGIGTLNPQSALSVNGTVQAKQVVVNTGWSDYVFASDYYLAPLEDVAAYIKANQHLPGMPSSAEVEKNGVSVGEVEAKLLEKIEELTLHMIEAEQRNRELERRLAQLEAQAARKENQ